MSVKLIKYAICTQRRNTVFHLTLTVLAVNLLVKDSNGHIAAFVSSDGRQNMRSLNFRGPTVPPTPETSNDVPITPSSLGFIKKLVGYPLTPHKEQYEKQPSAVTLGHNGASWQRDEDSSPNYLHKSSPAFVPFISPRALSNVNAYLRHLRDNLEALVKQESLSHSAGEPGTGVLTTHDIADRDFEQEELHSNWKSSPWIYSPRSYIHRSDTRRFIEEPTFPDTFFKSRQTPSAYNPSWSYLGLGKRSFGTHG